MEKGRLEAFSDGVIAIIITIMVLELKVPEGSSFETLRPLLPKFLSYLISFVYVGIYWNNHHHMFQIVRKVNGSVLWANLALLFTMSLIPFTTAWMGENHFDKNPVALYGGNLLLCSVAFTVLSKSIQRFEGEDSEFSRAVRNNVKEYISTALYVIGVILSFFYPQISVVVFAAVALIWLVPDSRIEKNISPDEDAAA